MIIENQKSFPDHTCVVIMAGGKGERFWPMSTETVPKPFLRIIGDKTLIQLTVERAGRMVPIERIFVVLGETHLAVAREQLPELPEGNFIVEPSGRDTAPCIGYSALLLSRRDKEAVMVMLPADQYIPDVDHFVETAIQGVRLAGMGNYLVTMGIRPSRPETGYGYIHGDRRFEGIGDTICYKVNKFVEKPDIARAKEYLADGNYYWNSGMFIWKASTIMDNIEKHMPELYDGLMEIQKALRADDFEAVSRLFNLLSKQSIDYGVMEKARDVLMIPSNFIWDDVGTWSSLLRVLEPDENGNCHSGRVLMADTKDCVFFSDGITIGAIGLKDIVVVASKGGVLVSRMDRAQEVREIAKMIEGERSVDNEIVNGE